MVDIGINVEKSDSPSKSFGSQVEGREQEFFSEAEANKEIQERHTKMIEICKLLSDASKDFEPVAIYQAVEKYIFKYERWLYADISNHFFGLSEERASTFLTNVDSLQTYAYMINRESEKEKTSRDKKIIDGIDRLWDHANLAKQQSSLQERHESDFKNSLDTYILPFKSDFSREMNSQFISLVAIFTALSFIVFGGISALDNIFLNAVRVPILELMILGSIWGICIANLVFVFIYFISKLTNTSIKSTESSNARLRDRYPFWFWSNFFLLLILAFSCWLYFVDYSQCGYWLIDIIKRYDVVSLIVGTGIIAAVFLVFAFVGVCKKGKKEEQK